jgi:putative transposase
MVSLLFAGITRPSFKRTVMAKLLTQVFLVRPQSGRILIGIVARFIPEWWPASSWNTRPGNVGIRMDATYLKVREGGRIVSRAVIIAVAVNDDGKREVLGVATGPSEAETFWTDFLRSLADRGLRGVKLVIADDHKGLRAAARRVFNATHQRCRIHWMHNALAHAPTKQRMAVAAMLKTIFAQETKADAETQWEVVADALREKQPKLGALMDASRDDVLAYMSFPREHWAQIASTNPLERVNREIKRRADVIGIFPNDDAIVRLVGALMLETNDEWAVARRYMSLETLARITDNPTIRLPAVAA